VLNLPQVEQLEHDNSHTGARIEGLPPTILFITVHGSRMKENTPMHIVEVHITYINYYRYELDSILLRS
jgi:hypothetical protein